MSEPLSERDLLRLIRSIVLAGRRAKKAGSSKLTRALDDAGYYAGLELGRLLKQREEVRRALERKWGFYKMALCKTVEIIGLSWIVLN
jgi:hypothetical protein